MDTRFVITEASLEWGGLFDVAKDAQWRNPHRAHRDGEHMDVRSTTLGRGQRDRFLLLCERARIRCVPETAPSHFHLSPMR